MVPFIAMALAGALAAGPLPIDAVTGNAAQLADTLGHAIGAASECGFGERADDAMARAEAQVSRAAAEERADDLAMDDRFHDALQTGREAVLDQTMTCSQAEQELKRLEGQTPD
jgi:hypothetical protein